MNGKDGQPDLSEYHLLVLRGVLDLVVQRGPAGEGNDGLINLNEALQGICDAIATLEHAAGVSETLRDRKKTADLCRQRILETGSALARAKEAGSPLSWQLQSIGKPN